jgi:hypothetical protein
MLYDGMRQVAERRGWKLDPPNPGALSLYSSVTLTGSDSGVPIRLERVGGAQTFTTIAYVDPPLPLHFAITHEGVLAKLAHLVGFHDVEIGDPEFDKSFRIAAKDPAAVKRLLNPSLRALLTKLSAQTKPLGMRGFRVTEEGVSLTRVTGIDDMVMSPEALLADVPITVAVVRALKEAATALA